MAMREAIRMVAIAIARIVAILIATAIQRRVVAVVALAMTRLARRTISRLADRRRSARRTGLPERLTGRDKPRCEKQRGNPGGAVKAHAVRADGRSEERRV